MKHFPFIFAYLCILYSNKDALVSQVGRNIKYILEHIF